VFYDYGRAERGDREIKTSDPKNERANAMIKIIADPENLAIVAFITPKFNFIMFNN